ncbi:amidohydrolase [Thermaerobacter sp. PB12/4term]|uniref:amidohydrolase n=1 Tax=Thermaerobacter sp. PB12/4term TaxID=2293838 RepID=UPI000E3283F5|nr:amidohydrolase [Thermaerobacter sp. PB12/4term]QIA26861.1 amidohydrolase [Thermaerobacter sp. PB12/4term]
MPVGASSEVAAGGDHGAASGRVLVGRIVPAPGSGVRPAEAVFFRGGRVEALGSEAAVRAVAGPRAEVEVLPRDAVVLPGFVDGHCHLLWCGQVATQLDLRDVTSLDELARRVARRAAQLPPGTWIEGYGWDQSRFDPPAWPDRALLDRAAPQHPVLLHRVCRHVAVASSAALAAAGVHRDTPDPAGGRFGRHPVTGELTGLLEETAIERVAAARPAPGLEERLAGLLEVIRSAHAAGITAVHSHDVHQPGELGNVLALYRAARERGRPLRVALDVGWEALDDARAWLPSGHGDAWLRMGSIKFFADGSLGGRTAALRDPYADGDGRERGLLRHSPEELASLVAEAAAAGYQVAIHCIGDRAVDAALAAVEAARRRAGPGRHRLIHVQVMAPEHPAQLAAAGVVAEIQPRFLASDLAFVEERLGPGRSRWAYAWRSLREAGVPLSAGSDAPIEPLAPLEGIQAAVTRDDLQGDPPGGWHPEERLAVGEALQAYTAGAACGALAEGLWGSLLPGAMADAVVLGADPWRVAPHELHHIPVLATYVDGEPVYRRPAG